MIETNRLVGDPFEIGLASSTLSSRPTTNRNKMEKEEGRGRFLQRFVPARVVFVVLGSFGFFLCYAFKTVLSMAIVAMVKTEKEPPALPNVTVVFDGDACPGSNAINQNDHIGGQGEFDWDDSVKNYVLASFFYGYVLTQIPAGILANYYGGKWIFGISLLIASVASLFSPVAARQGYMWFIALRVIQGLAEGVVFPCINTMIAQWMPKMERCRGSTIIFTGSMIGTVATLPMASAFNNSRFGWEASFYLLGIIGIIWFILYAIFVYESPESHPFISREEKEFILFNGGGKQTTTKVVIPYRKIFTSVPVYGLILTNFGQNWAFLTILNYMPTYMNEVLHTSNSQNTIISGMPYLGQAIFGWIVSYFTDRIRASGRISITKLRKINSFIAYVPTALCIGLVPVAGCNQLASCILMILCIAINGACFSGFNSTHVDMAPDYAGTLMGLTNSFGNIPGFLVPKVVEMITKNQKTVASWSWVFYSAAAVNILTAMAYIGLCTAKEQPWGRNSRQQPDDAIDQKL